MSTPAKPPSGPDLWVHLTLDDVRALIRNDVAELKRLHALKAIDDDLPAQKRNILLRAEIKAWEAAHDAHFEWMREIAAREPRSASEPAL